MEFPLVRVYWKAAREAWNWSRQVHRFHPGSLKVFKRHLRWATAAALRPTESLAWFAFHDLPEMQGFAHANPRLVFRALTSYMSVRWGLVRRTKVIQDTYLFVVHRGGFLAEAMRRPDGMTLAELDLDRGQKARIRIGSDAQFRKEGEISLFLELEGVEGPVTGMALSIEQDGGCLDDDVSTTAVALRRRGNPGEAGDLSAIEIEAFARLDLDIATIPGGEV